MTIRQTLRGESLHCAPGIFGAPLAPRGMSALLAPATQSGELSAAVELRRLFPGGHRVAGAFSASA